MKLKKINAAFGLFSMAFVLFHVFYMIITLSMFDFGRVVSITISYITLSVLMVHVVIALIIVLFKHEGSSLSSYPKENRRVILQRLTAVLMLALIFVHINTFHIFEADFDAVAAIVLNIIIKVSFFACVFNHIATSFSSALITLGLLESLEKKKIIDRTVYIIFGILFVVSLFAVLRAEIIIKLFIIK